MIKIHQLLHVIEQLILYGMIGLFAEDSAESIHAIVNLLARRYAALDSSRRATQVMRALEMRKRNAAAKLAEDKEKGKDITKKQKREQGKSAITLDSSTAVDPADAVEDAAQSILAVLNSDASNASENFSLKACDCCQKDLGTDMMLPNVYMPLHKHLCHVEAVGDKFSTKAKRLRNSE